MHVILLAAMLGFWNANPTVSEDEYFIQYPHEVAYHTCGFVSARVRNPNGDVLPDGWTADVLASGGALQSESKTFFGVNTRADAKAWVQQRCDAGNRISR